MKRMLLVDERGFSLTEVLVTMIIMVIVLFSLYSLFDMTLRVFSVGNDKTEAAENARLGLEKMKREIRAAFPYNKANASTTDDYLFWNSTPPTAGAIPSSDSITFGNDLDGDYKVETDTSTEQISYTYDSSSKTLRRTVGTGTAQPVVEFVKEVDTESPIDDNTPLTFTYCMNYDGTDDSNDGCPTGFDVATSEGSIRVVRIKLEVSVDRGIQEQPSTQILTTDVSLRNRGEQ